MDCVESPRFRRLAAGAPCHVHALRLVLRPDGPTVVVLRLWPRPAAWARGSEPGLWLPEDVSTPLVARGCELQALPETPWLPDLRSLAKALLPQWVEAVLGGVPAELQWDCLRLLDAVPRSAELMAENPVLMAALAATVSQELPARYEEIAAGLTGPRRDLLPLLDLPRRRWMVRLLSRLESSALDRRLLSDLVVGLRSDDRRLVKALQHLRPLPRHVLQVVLHPDLGAEVATAMLQEAATRTLEELHLLLGYTPHGESPLVGAFDTVRLFGEREGRPKPHPRTLGHLARLVREAELDLAEPWDPASFDAFAEGPAGQCSLPTSPRVEVSPLEDAAALYAHAAEQLVCIVADPEYPSLAQDGRAAFFAVIWGDRSATLMLARDGLAWVVEELRGACNEDVPGWLADALAGWAEGLGEGSLP